MNRSELLEEVLALLRDLDEARESEGAAADFCSRKEAVLERVNQVLNEREGHHPRENDS